MGKFHSEEKKFLKYGVGFSFFLVGVLFSVEWILANFVSFSNEAQTGKINLVMNRRVDPELIIIGSSVAEVGFNSNIISNETNLTVYNLAIDGTTLSGSEFLVDEFLSYSENCKIVIIGMSFFSLSEIKAMTAPERYLAHKSNAYVKKNIKNISPSLYEKLYKIPFYSFVVANQMYYKNAIFGIKSLLSKSQLTQDSLKGFVPHYSNYEDTSNDNLTLNTINFSIKSKVIYKRILRKIKHQGVRPILVITPMHINGQQSFDNYKDFCDSVRVLAKELEVELWDFSKYYIVDNKNYYYNNGHLNYIGASIFSNAISDSLKMHSKN